MLTIYTENTKATITPKGLVRVFVLSLPSGAMELIGSHKADTQKAGLEWAKAKLTELSGKVSNRS